MSRGPGQLQRRILELLSLYEDIGRSLEWEWREGGRFCLGRLANADDIEAYEAGRRIELWKLRRDTGADRTSLSRALHSLSQRGLVVLFGGELGIHIKGDWPPYVKYAGITAAGKALVKRQQRTSAETHKT